MSRSFLGFCVLSCLFPRCFWSLWWSTCHTSHLIHTLSLSFSSSPLPSLIGCPSPQSPQTFVSLAVILLWLWFLSSLRLAFEVASYIRPEVKEKPIASQWCWASRSTWMYSDLDFDDFPASAHSSQPWDIFVMHNIPQQHRPINNTSSAPIPGLCEFWLLWEKARHLHPRGCCWWLLPI